MLSIIVMRFIYIVLVCLLVVSQVSAVSLLIPDSFSDSVSVNEGNSVKFTFSVRGDAEKTDVKFFVNSDADGGLSINGVNNYVKTLSLKAFEVKDVLVEIEGVKPGSYSVHYGFTYSGEGEDISFDQVVQNEFTVVVREVTNDDDDDFVSSSSSGGGGGGGVFIEPEVELNSEDVINDVLVDEKKVVDKSAPVVSNPKVVNTKDLPAALSVPVSSSDSNGKYVLGLFLFLLVIFMTLGLFTIKTVKEVKSS